MGRSGGSTEQKSSSSTIPAAIGAGVGGIVFGLLAGAFGIFVFGRSRSGKRHREDMMRDSPLGSENSPQSRETPVPHVTTNMVTGGLEYVVEPFSMPPGTPSSPPSGSSDPLLRGGDATSPTIMSRADAMSTSGSSQVAETSGGRRATRNVYVVHHDGGHAPVSVYTDEGADVVELPPRYAAGSSNAPSETSSTDVMRRGGSTRKTREPPRT